LKERRFYVPESFERIIEKMEKILKREGSNLSKWIRQNIEEYVRRHEPGNPQQRIERYKDGDAKPFISAKGCAYCNRDATRALRWKKDRLVPLCKLHYNLFCKSPNWTETGYKVGEK